MTSKLGVSGSVAKVFLTSKITPLFAIVGLLLGLFAIIVTPREEEPQINVTFANIFIPFPGASSKEVEQLVSTPAEQVLSEIEGIKHIYSVSKPGMSILTVQYIVGEDRSEAIVRLYNAIYSNQDWLPKNAGIGQPIIKPKGIDDVPILTFTLWTDDVTRGAYDLQQVAHSLEIELKRVKGTRDIFTIGGADQVAHVLLDPVKMAGYNITIEDLRQALVLNNTSESAGALIRDNREILVQAGRFLSTPDDLSDLIIGVSNSAPVYLKDVATIKFGADQPEQYVWLGTGPAANDKGIVLSGEYPAVTIAIAKKSGTNAVEISDKLIKRIEQLKGVIIPEGVQVTVTRDYGETADNKAKKLISKLIFATAAVVLLVFFTLGGREAVIVGAAVVITLMMTLFASWAWGFTINRVSLFALIFSIGILVDDAIVVVENIHRHIQMGSKNLIEAIPLAVDEVGGPTILATFAVIAALLPMAFVTGLMGPYMSPIPVNASMGMLISLAVAFVITPWMALKVIRTDRHGDGQHNDGKRSDEKYNETNKKFIQFFSKLISPFIIGTKSRRRRWLLFTAVTLLVLGSIGLAAAKLVVLKMLPFDNKSELQVIVDMPEGTAVEKTAQVLTELGRYIASVPEVTDYQVYAGTASPINFNGLVRQYYLREEQNTGDIQVNLVGKAQRDRMSHDIALAIRSPLRAIAKRYDANIKIVEVPPGPPVQSPLVAEIYGLDQQGQRQIAGLVREVFERTNDVVDVDDSVEITSPKITLIVDRQKATLLGVSHKQITDAIKTVLKGEDVSYLHDANSKFPIPIRLEFAVGDKAGIESLLALKLRGINNKLIPMSDIVLINRGQREHAIYHKDLLPVTFVTGDAAGSVDSPLYGMFDMVNQLSNENSFSSVDQYFLNQPEDVYRYGVKWDGEWQITYETFRDMGIAYAVGIIFIYLLVTAQFRSYLVPIIVMSPIPLTIIGVMPGHMLFGMPFTATSMIGMIALAGIIVRNSILLVDFINQQIDEGIPMEQAVIYASAVRAKPIFLTGFAAMMGAYFILDDPIFSGLAVSLIFGILVSMLLTLLIVPVLHYAFFYKRV